MFVMCVCVRERVYHPLTTTHRNRLFRWFEEVRRRRQRYNKVLKRANIGGRRRWLNALFFQNI